MKYMIQKHNSLQVAPLPNANALAIRLILCDEMMQITR